MTVPTLPVDGQTAWGDELNAGILTVNTTANNAASAAANHAANVPADPHGDRAYSLSLVSPITTGVNAANGYVKLDNHGHLAGSMVYALGGSFTNVYDAVANYGAVPNTGADQTAAIQSALTACSSAGGGVVWLGAGTFSLAGYLVIGSNTMLLMSEGTVLSRISGSPTPPYLISNVQFGTSNTPSTNVKIVGGKLDAIGASNLTTACTPIFLIQSGKTVIEDVIINNVFNNPAIELNGVPQAYLANLDLTGKGSAVTQATVPSIRVNVSNTHTTPTGLAGGIYNNATTNNVVVVGCRWTGSTTFANWGSFLAMDMTYGGATCSNISVIGCETTMPANNGIPLPSANISTFSNAGCIFADYPGLEWSPITLSGPTGWSNSGFGPNFQYRIVNSNTLEVIGDLSAGTITDGTPINFVGIPFYSKSPQTLSITLPNASSSAPQARIYWNGSGTFSIAGISALTGTPRVSVHGFISLDA